MLLLASQDLQLGAKSDTEWVTGLVVMGIWVVFSIIGALSKKQKEQERQRKLREKLVPGGTPSAADVARQRSQAVAAQSRQLQQLQQIARTTTPSQSAQRGGKKQPASKRRPAPVMSAPPPIPGRSDAGNAPYADIARNEITGSGVARAAVSANAGALNRWLRPETLRQQFIVTEILQPPLALREPRQI